MWRLVNLTGHSKTNYHLATAAPWTKFCEPYMLSYMSNMYMVIVTFVKLRVMSIKVQYALMEARVSNVSGEIHVLDSK